MPDLHPATGLRPGGWYACQEPERPPVPELTAYDFSCTACCIHAEAARRVAAGQGVELAMEERTRSGLEVGRGRNLSRRLAEREQRGDEAPA